jgi:hypothetical protein
MEDVCQKLRDEIQRTEREQAEYLEKAEKTSQLISARSNEFAVARKLNRVLQELQDSFAEMFERTDKTATIPELQKVIKENADLKKEVIRLRFELGICNQITSRLTLLDEAR